MKKHTLILLVIGFVFMLQSCKPKDDEEVKSEGNIPTINSDGNNIIARDWKKGTTYFKVYGSNLSNADYTLKIKQKFAGDFSFEGYSTISGTNTESLWNESWDKAVADLGIYNDYDLYATAELQVKKTKGNTVVTAPQTYYLTSSVDVDTCVFYPGNTVVFTGETTWDSIKVGTVYMSSHFNWQLTTGIQQSSFVIKESIPAGFYTPKPARLVSVLPDDFPFQINGCPNNEIELKPYVGNYIIRNSTVARNAFLSIDVDNTIKNHYRLTIGTDVFSTENSTLTKGYDYPVDTRRSLVGLVVPATIPLGSNSIKLEIKIQGSSNYYEIETEGLKSITVTN